MPWLTKRWISFFAFSAAVGVVLVSVAGWANSKEADKRQNQLGQFSFSFPSSWSSLTLFAKTHSERIPIAISLPPTTGLTGQTPIKH